MFVNEIMTKNVKTVMPEYSVSKAFQILTENGHSQLPVVDENNKLLGIITEKLLAEVNPSKATSLSVYEINYLLTKTTVKDILKNSVFSVNQNKLIEHSALIMKENRISSLPVVDDDGFLVGIITRIDIFKAFIDIMGVNVTGTRISIKANDSVGFIADITKIIASENINIKNISNFNTGEYSEITLKLETLEVDSLISKLKDKGYNILSIDK